MGKYTPLSEKPLVFLDTETTSLDPQTGEIIEIAIIREFPDGRVDEWVTKIQPQHLETAEDEALEINGYTPEKWVGSPVFADVASEIKERLHDGVYVGHNVSFDLEFIEAEMRRVGVEIRFHHRIDTGVLAYEHLVPCGLKSVSFVNVRKFLGGSLNNIHTALQDTRDVRRLYHLLNKSGHRARLWWRVQHRVRRLLK